MNRLKLFFVLVCGSVFVLSSCQENSDIDLEYYIASENNKYLGASNSSLSFISSGAATQRLDIKATNVSWELTDIPSWLTVTPPYGKGNGNVLIHCSDDASGKGRTANIVLRSVDPNWNFSYTIKIKQDPKNAPVTITKLYQTSTDYLKSGDYAYKYHWCIQINRGIDDVVEIGFELDDDHQPFSAPMEDYTSMTWSKMWTTSSQSEVWHTVRGFVICSDSTKYYTEDTDFFLYDYDY